MIWLGEVPVVTQCFQGPSLFPLDPQTHRRLRIRSIFLQPFFSQIDRQLIVVSRVQADQLELQGLGFQALQQRIVAGMIQQFVIDPQCLLQIPLLFKTFSLPGPGMQSPQLTAIPLMHLLEFVCGLIQQLLEFTRSRVVSLSLLIGTLGQAECLQDDVPLDFRSGRMQLGFLLIINVRGKRLE